MATAPPITLTSSIVIKLGDGIALPDGPFDLSPPRYRAEAFADITLNGRAVADIKIREILLSEIDKRGAGTSVVRLTPPSLRALAEYLTEATTAVTALINPTPEAEADADAAWHHIGHLASTDLSVAATAENSDGETTEYRIRTAGGQAPDAAQADEPDTPRDRGTCSEQHPAFATEARCHRPAGHEGDHSLPTSDPKATTSDGETTADPKPGPPFNLHDEHALVQLRTLISAGHTYAKISAAGGPSDSTISTILNLANAGPLRDSTRQKITNAFNTLSGPIVSVFDRIDTPPGEPDQDAAPVEDIDSQAHAETIDEDAADAPEELADTELPPDCSWADWYKRHRLGRRIPNDDPLLAEIKTLATHTAASLREIATELGITRYNVLDVLRRSGHHKLADQLADYDK